MSPDFKEADHVEPRQWSWVYRALWSCVPRAGQETSSSTHKSDSNSGSRGSSGSGKVSCRLEMHVLDTVLFDHGEPRKWVGSSNEGVVVRKSFPSRNNRNDSGLPVWGVDTIESISTARSSPSSSLSKSQRRPDLMTRIAQTGSSKRLDKTMDEFQVLERLDAIRAAFLALATTKTRPHLSQDSDVDPPICVAWYNDGTTELLSEELLSRLGAYHNWRVSVTGLQAYVRPRQRATGTYEGPGIVGCTSRRQSKDRRNKNSRRVASECPNARGNTSDTYPTLGSAEGDAVSDSTGAPIETATSNSCIDGTLDKAATDVAYVVDMSYAWPHTLRPAGGTDEVDAQTVTTSTTLSSTEVQLVNVNGQKVPKRPPWPKSRVRVAHLEAEFIVDETNCAWFSHAIRTLVRPVARPPQTEVDEERQALERKREQNEAKLAASVASRELQALLAMAGRRGLDANEAFEHFDPEHEGFVDMAKMRKGMASLGVALSDDAATIVVELVIACAEAGKEGQTKSSSNMPTETAPGERELQRKGLTVGVTVPGVGPHHVCSQRKTSAGRRWTYPRQRFTAEDLWTFSNMREDLAGNEETKGEGASPNEGSQLSGKSISRSRESVEAKKISAAAAKRRRTSGDTTTSHQHAPNPFPQNIGLERLFRGTERQHHGTCPIVSDDGHGKRSGSRCTRCSSNAPTSRSAFDSQSERTAISTPDPRAVARESSCLVDSAPSSGGSISPRRKLAEKYAGNTGHSPGHIYKSTYDSIKDAGVRLQGKRLREEPPDVASFPCSDPVAEATSGKDRVFHVDRGLVIAFRVLRSIAPSREPNSAIGTFGNGRKAETTALDVDNSKRRRERPPKSAVMVVVPGLFQTLDTLESALRPLLNAHPGLTALLVAPPGLPNTHWPVSAILDGKLTAFCVATLLEHLLTGDDLVPEQQGPVDEQAPSDRAAANRRPERPTAPAYKITDFLESDTAAIPAQGEKKIAEYHDETTSMAQKDAYGTEDAGVVEKQASPKLSETRLCPTDDADAGRTSSEKIMPTHPIIFVGFGTGANSLLRFVGCSMLSSPTCSSDEIGLDDGKSIYGSQATLDGDPTMLASALMRKGLHVGGLVLVNGFVDAEDASNEVLDTLRQAFCNQSDGRARVEAVTSLLLSEQHLESVGGSAAATKIFISNREVLCLDAEVTAAETVKTGRKDATDQADFQSVPSRSGGGKVLSISTSCAEETGGKEPVTVASVLKEIECKERKRRTKGAWERRSGRHRPRKRDRSIVEGGLPLETERGSDKGANNGEFLADAVAEESQARKRGERTESTLSSASQDAHRSDDVELSMKSLALAASVSCLDGLLHHGTLENIETWSASHHTPEFERTVADTVSSLDPHARSAGDRDRSIFQALQRVGLPLVMIQSTEDALIGTPLPFSLKKQMLAEDLVAHEACSVFECMRPLKGSESLNSHSAFERQGGEASKSFQDGEELRRSEEQSKAPHAERTSGPGEKDKHAPNSLRMHACWVKAGHEMLHERTPFLLSLLNKVIHACHGEEVPNMTGMLPPPLAVPESDTNKPDGDGNANVSVFDITENGGHHDDGKITDDDRYAGNGGGKGDPRSTRLSIDSRNETDSSAVTADDQNGLNPVARALSNSGVACLRHDERAVTEDDISSWTTKGTESTRGASLAEVITPKLLDFYDFRDPVWSREMWVTRDYIEACRELDLERAVLENNLGCTRNRIEILDVPAVARYAFQSMKDCWRWRMMAVEATRLELEMKKRQGEVRDQLSHAVRSVNNLTRTLRKSGRVSVYGEVDEMLLLLPEDQRVLRADIAAAEAQRATHYDACRKLRRRGTVFRARRDRLKRTLVHVTDGARGTVQALERIMGQLRRQLVLMRVQERVYQQALQRMEDSGLQARRRLTAVEHQLDDLKRHPFQWTDSDAWQAGYVQRIESSALVKLLAEESDKLRVAAEKAREQSDHARDVHSTAEAQKAELAATMEGVGVVFSLLRSALEDENFARDLEAAAADQQAIENKVLGIDDTTHRGEGIADGHGNTNNPHPNKRRKQGPRGLPTAAARIRATNHRSRNAEEKRWVALDAVLNPSLYHHVTQSEAEEMRWDALYYTRLDQEDLRRILSLPVQAHLALAFLDTPDEVTAHELLGRYTLGIAANHLSRLDRNSQDVSEQETVVRLAGSTPDPVSIAAAATAADASGMLRVAAADKRVNVQHEGTDTIGTVGGVQDDGAENTPSRILACMRRNAQAQLKTLAERDKGEAVWLALDKTLRPGFYEEAEEAAGNRDEESHREADAKEDARQTWLRKDNAAPRAGVPSGDEKGSISGGADTMDRADRSEINSRRGDEAGEDIGVGDDAGAQGAIRREALAIEIAEAFCDNRYLKRLTAAVLGDVDRSFLDTATEGSSAFLGKEVEETIPVQEDDSTGDQTNDDHPSHRTSGSSNEHVAALAAEKSYADVLRGETVGTTGASGSISTAAPDQNGREAEGFDSSDTNLTAHRPLPTNVNDGNSQKQQGSDRSGKRGKATPTQHFGQLEKVAKAALARFLVREEETPLGREMTRSLAMLQEVAIRLGSGQVGVMHGLNQQVAMAALCRQSRSHSPDATIAAVDPSAEITADTTHTPPSTVPASSMPQDSSSLPETSKSCSSNPQQRHTENGASIYSEDSVARRSSIAGAEGTAAGGVAGSRLYCDNHRSDVGDHNKSESWDRCQRNAAERRHQGFGASVGTVAGGEVCAATSPEAKRTINKMHFGSWEVIHPASLGSGSQKLDWPTGASAGVVECVHPASFIMSTNTRGEVDDWSLSSASVTGFSIGDISALCRSDPLGQTPVFDPLEILTGKGCPPVAGWLATVGESNLVASAMDRVGELDPGEVRRRGLLVASRRRACLLDVKTCELQAGQSRAHSFKIGPYETLTRRLSTTETPTSCGVVPKVMVGLAVTVVFQGNFEKEGYRLGRLAAGLYRMPPENKKPRQANGEMLEEVNPAEQISSTEQPQPVGFAPHYLQSLNTAETMGRIMIFHQPRVQPVREGRFQLVIGAASRVRYSATVTALTAADAHAVLDEKLAEATRLQCRLPVLLKELDMLKDTSKLSRWKQRIVRELMEEAQEEAVRCDSELNEIKREIQEDGNDQKLDDDGRRALLAEARDIGAELTRWKMLFASRCQEGKDIRAGLALAEEQLKTLEKEANTLQKTLSEARKSLPAAAFVLKSQRDATDVALRLNASIDPFSGDTARWAAADVIRERGEAMLSPAEKVRRVLKEEGWDTLTVDEKRFTMLDRVLRPDLYMWMRTSSIGEDGSTIISNEGQSSIRARKDSLVGLIGAGPLASIAMDSVETIEQAMEARKKKGWSKKARDYATPGAFSGGGRRGRLDTGAGSVGTGGSLTGRSDTSGGGGFTSRFARTAERSGTTTARTSARTTARSQNTIATALTLADIWALPDFSFNAMELKRVMKAPFHRLQREELRARKLLRRFHDERGVGGSKAEPLANQALAFEKRCAAVRAKDANARTQEERDWCEIDKQLFPKVWRSKRRQKDRLRRFNMTLTTMPRGGRSFAGYGNASDSDQHSYDSNSSNSSTGSFTTMNKKRNRDWKCTFDREEILQIWARDPEHTPVEPPVERVRGVDPVADQKVDMAKVQRLLLEFNGPFASFVRNEDAWSEKRDKEGGPLSMSTSKRIAIFSENLYQSDLASLQGSHNSIKEGGRVGGGRAPDVHITMLLHELMAAKTISSKYMDTDVMHSTAQRFNTQHYAAELEKEITGLLREQVLERERNMEHTTKIDARGHNSVSESSDDDAENWELGVEEEAPLPGHKAALSAVSQVTPAGNANATSFRGHRNDGRRGTAGSANGLSVTAINGREPTKDTVGPVGGDDHGQQTAGTPGRTGSGLAQEETDPGVSGPPRSKWLEPPEVQEFTEKEVAHLIQDDPFWPGCRACLTIPCRWCSCIDSRAIMARKEQLRDELFRLMGLYDEVEVVTLVPLSCVRGGQTTLPKYEAIRELRWEGAQLDQQVHLATIDKELHDSYNCALDAIEVRCLHAYSTLMWTADAKVALQKARDLALARTTAVEVVDDLLESMLDGWVFGERQAEHAAGGYIPAVKLSGPLRPGDQRRAATYLAHRHRLRKLAHAKGERLPEEVKGTHHSKALPIDDGAQKRIIGARADKKTQDKEFLLKETETTMKFGLFSMVQGYLHAMRLVQREKEAWSGRGDAIGRDIDTHFRTPQTVERRKMVQEEVKARERAAARRNFLSRARVAEDRATVREAQNKRHISQRKANRILEVRARERSARNIQRVFRGFRSKIFAQRWALKCAEVEALKSVLHEAAINIQRAYRGHLGRMEASEVRMELAEYIADIRVKEAESDLADFWETHKLLKTKANMKKKMMNTVGLPLLYLRRKQLE